MNIRARPATATDAVRAIEIVRASIAQLCVADHHNDPQTLERWLANKTPAHFGDWLGNPDNYCVVGEREGQVDGVGLLHRSGEIRLFYIAPGAQRVGLGRAIHAALEAQAQRWQLPNLHLCSTEGARAFYEALGYRAGAPRRHLFGELRCVPYVKPLRG